MSVRKLWLAIGIVIALVCATSGVTAAPCTYTFPNGHVYDLSPLATAAGTTFQDIKDGSTLSINFCGFAEGDGPNGVCAQNNASVCLNYSWAPTWFAIAEWGNDEPQWEEVGTDAIQLSFSNGFLGAQPAVVTIELLCLQEGRANFAVEFTQPATWSISVQSAAGCQLNPPKPTMTCNHTFPDGSFFDLSSLTTPNGTTISSQFGQACINVCGIAAGDGLQGNCALNRATLCYAMQMEGWMPVATLNSTQPSWELIDPSNPNTGVQMIYTDGDFMGSIPLVIFLFYCSPGSEGQFEITYENLGAFVVTIKTAAACPKSLSKVNSILSFSEE